MSSKCTKHIIPPQTNGLHTVLVTWIYSHQSTLRLFFEASYIRHGLKQVRKF